MLRTTLITVLLGILSGCEVYTAFDARGRGLDLCWYERPEDLWHGVFRPIEELTTCPPLSEDPAFSHDFTLEVAQNHAGCVPIHVSTRSDPCMFTWFALCNDGYVYRELTAIQTSEDTLEGRVVWGPAGGSNACWDFYDVIWTRGEAK